MQVVKIKEAKVQRIVFLVIVSLIFSVIAYYDVPSSYFKYSNGNYNNALGGIVNFSYRTGSETQYIHIYEQVYENGKLVSTQRILSLGAAGEVRKSKLSLMLTKTSDLGWAISTDGAVTHWTSKMEHPQTFSREVEYLHTRKRALTGEDDFVLAAVYQVKISGRLKEVYPQDCETVLDDLDAVISKNDMVVLIHMATSKKPFIL